MRESITGPRRAPTPLELLHPDGVADGVAVHGSGAAAVAIASRPAGDEGLDLVLLAPSRAEARSGSWFREAARWASALKRDGIVVASQPRRRLLAELAHSGFETSARLLHVPDVARSRYVVPLSGRARRYAMEHLIPLHPLKRAVVPALRVPGIAAIGPTSVVLQRSGSRPPLAWLCEGEPSGQACGAVLARSWRPQGSVVAHRFGREPQPEVVVKVGGGAAREASALEACAPTAVDFVNVPSLLRRGTLGGTPLVVQTAIAGTPAALLLRDSPERARRLLEAVGGWLIPWSERTAVRRPFGPAEAARHLLTPARRLAPLLDDGDAYASGLQRLCERASGVQVPFVVAHNDLTAPNVLCGTREELGIVDWEEAEGGCLPLGDLIYAIADFAAAVAGYRDRSAAYPECFQGSGRMANLADRLLGEAAARLAIGDTLAELCAHACWLRHADNELRREGEGSADGPFLAILRMAASRIPA